jgi:hypothetical protein
MNKNHEKYKDFLSTKNNWSLDDWSINCECFEKIVELIEFDKTILELGSGKSTELLSRFYNIISVEDDIKYLNKYDSTYIHVRTIGDGEYDFKNLKDKLIGIDYDLLLIDGPNNNRQEIIKHIEMFKNDIPIIWDDTQVYEKYAIEMSEKLNVNYETYQCRPQGEHWRNYSNGKRFTVLK